MNPPKPPRTLTKTPSKRTFFSRFLYSIGLKHEHLRDFDELTHLQHEKSEPPIIDTALDHVSAKKTLADNADGEEEFSIAINGVEQDLQEEIVDNKPKDEKPKTFNVRSFAEETPSLMEMKKPGHFSQDTEYTLRKTLTDEFSLFKEDFDSKKESDWLNSDKKISEGQNSSDFTKEINEDSEPKKKSLFTEEVEGEKI